MQQSAAPAWGPALSWSCRSKQVGALCCTHAMCGCHSVHPGRQAVSVHWAQMLRLYACSSLQHLVWEGCPAIAAYCLLRSQPFLQERDQMTREIERLKADEHAAVLEKKRAAEQLMLEVQRSNGEQVRPSRHVLSSSPLMDCWFSSVKHDLRV